MSTQYNPNRPLQYDAVVTALPPGLFVSKSDATRRQTWVRPFEGSDDRLCIWGNFSNDEVQFERFGVANVGPILQSLADHLDVAFTCELGLERIDPGGDGIVEIYAESNDDEK